MIGREEVEHARAQCQVLLEHDRAALARDKRRRIDEARERDELAASLSAYAIASVSGLHGTGQRRPRAEEVRLGRDQRADLADGQAVFLPIVAVGAAGVLHRLERDAAHAAAQRGEADDVADLVVVHALLQRHDERRRQSEPVEPLQRG
jgi:hypothetical protein